MSGAVRYLDELQLTAVWEEVNLLLKFLLRSSYGFGVSSYGLGVKVFEDFEEKGDLVNQLFILLNN